jgi:hypothetical protein
MFQRSFIFKNLKKEAAMAKYFKDWGATHSSLFNADNPSLLLNWVQAAIHSWKELHPIQQHYFVHFSSQPGGFNRQI